MALISTALSCQRSRTCERSCPQHSARRKAALRARQAGEEKRLWLCAGAPSETQLAARLYYVVSEAEGALEGLRIRWMEEHAAAGMPLVDVCKTELV